MNNFISLINGVKTLVSAITSSAGTIDGNKIISTNSEGKIDKSLLNKYYVYLDCGILPNFEGSTRYTTTPGFSTIPVYDITFNSHQNNLSNNLFKIPITGIYLVVSKIRVTDQTPAINYGQGVHSSNSDGNWLIWGNTFTNAAFNRNGLLNSRITIFNQNDFIRLYTYTDGNVGISSSNLVLYLLETI